MQPKRDSYSYTNEQTIRRKANVEIVSPNEIKQLFICMAIQTSPTGIRQIRTRLQL